MAHTRNIFRLKGAIQEYEWGKPGSSSLVAKYAPASVGRDYNIEEDKNYAEVRPSTNTCLFLKRLRELNTRYGWELIQMVQLLSGAILRYHFVDW